MLLASDNANGKVPYPAEFFAGIDQGATMSATKILGALFEVYRPQSVLDVGCGQGAWLAAAEKLGVDRLSGIDGPWVDKGRLLSPRIDFVSKNLDHPFEAKYHHDLCISVEVAEHLEPSAAQGFVQSLCSTSDVIVFSAAIPQQGGVSHVNERWQSYWAGLFDELGYECFDYFRPRMWSAAEVECWYRQNVLLYVKRTNPLYSKMMAERREPLVLDVVHPKIYEGNLENYSRQVDRPSLKLCVSLFGRWIAQRLGGR